MSNVIATVVQWPDNSEDPLHQRVQAACIATNHEEGFVEIGAGLVKMPAAGRVYLRFQPDELAAALALAMFNRDE